MGVTRAAERKKDTMGFLSGIVRFLFWLLILSWSVAMLRRVVGWILRGSNTAPPQSGDTPRAEQPGLAARRLVRDPVCGVHVAEHLSIPLREGSEVLHFCSTACRDKYAGSAKRLAANG